MEVNYERDIFGCVDVPPRNAYSTYKTNICDALIRKAKFGTSIRAEKNSVVEMDKQ